MRNERRAMTWKEIEEHFKQALNKSLKRGRELGLTGGQLRVFMKQAMPFHNPTASENRLWMELLNRLERELEKMKSWQKRDLPPCTGDSSAQT